MALNEYDKAVELLASAENKKQISSLDAANLQTAQKRADLAKLNLDSSKYFQSLLLSEAAQILVK
jgi:hypothetical protein